MCPNEGAQRPDHVNERIAPGGGLVGPSLRRTSNNRVSLMSVVALLAACRGETTLPSSAAEVPSTPSSRLIVPPDDGAPTYYSYSTTLTSTGSLPGWNEPQRLASRTFQEEYEWNPQGYWRAQMNFGQAYAIAVGYQPAPVYDLATAVKVRNVITSYSRTGAQMQGPPPALDLVPAGGSSFLRIATVPTMARLTSPLVGDGGAPSAVNLADERAHRVDALVITRNGGARALALLRTQFGSEQRQQNGLLQFRKSIGDRTTTVIYDPGISAVSLLEASVNGVKRSETRRIYRRQEGVVVLAAVEHTMFDSAGKQSASFRREISNLTIR